jgi:hypothetical protein
LRSGVTFTGNERPEISPQTGVPEPAWKVLKAARAASASLPGLREGGAGTMLTASLAAISSAISAVLRPMSAYPTALYPGGN